MDKSAQMDELDSLKSIYYSEEFQVTSNGEQYDKIQAIFWAFNKLPDDYVIKYLEVPGSHDALYLKIKHLPPIELRLTFPPDYPSKNPPGFVISCQWLPRSKIALLCKKLDDLWLEYGPVEIVYTWSDFLKNDALTYLKCENELDLRELCSKHLSFLQRLERQQAKEGSLIKNQEPETTPESGTQISVSLCDGKSKENEGNVTPGPSMNLKLKNVKSFKEGHHQHKYRTKYPYQRKRSENGVYSTKKDCRYKNKLDERAVLDLNIKTSPLRLLENYNAERERVQFLRNFYTCNICFSDKLGKDCTKFQNCDHVFCVDCIRSYFTVRIRDGTVQSIKCPEDKCTTEALPSQIKEIVSDELFAKYDTVLLNTALDTLSDIIYCPRQLCQYPVSWEPEEKMASCPNCQYVFCVTCKMVYHGIEPCQFKSVEVKELVQQYENASEKVKSQMESKYGKERLETLINNTKTEAWIEENSKACPRCNVAIEKAYGCNKMVCWKCNAFFCWLCSSILDVKNPYLHYRDPNSKCVDKLFYLVNEFEEEEGEDEWDWVENEFLDSDSDDGLIDEDDPEYDEDEYDIEYAF